MLKDVIGFRVSQVFKKELEARGFTGKLRVDNADRVIEMIVRMYVLVYFMFCICTIYCLYYVHS